MFGLFKKEEKPFVKFSTKEDLLELIPHPVPAKKAMPEWFRKLKPTVDNSSIGEAGTAKRCMPILDAVSQGFIIPMWTDVAIKVSKTWELHGENGLITTIPVRGDKEDFIGKNLSDVENEPVVTEVHEGEIKVFIAFPNEESFGIGDMSSGHNWEQVGNACDLKKFALGKTLLKFSNPWVIETAPGWSCKFQNPANNWSNDIELIEGVVDTDSYYNEVNFPFVWTGSEEGEFLIKRGTPLAHAIPFKRTDVELKTGVIDEEKKKHDTRLLATKLFDRYKTFNWHKRRDQCPVKH